jgi:hypothetical protein
MKYLRIICETAQMATGFPNLHRNSRHGSLRPPQVDHPGCMQATKVTLQDPTSLIFSKSLSSEGSTCVYKPCCQGKLCLYQQCNRSNPCIGIYRGLDQNKPQYQVLGWDQSLIRFQFIEEMILHREIQSRYPVLGLVPIWYPINTWPTAFGLEMWLDTRVTASKTQYFWHLHLLGPPERVPGYLRRVPAGTWHIFAGKYTQKPLPWISAWLGKYKIDIH